MAARSSEVMHRARQRFGPFVDAPMGRNQKPINLGDFRVSSQTAETPVSPTYREALQARPQESITGFEQVQYVDSSSQDSLDNAFPKGTQLRGAINTVLKSFPTYSAVTLHMTPPNDELGGLTHRERHFGTEWRKNELTQAMLEAAIAKAVPNDRQFVNFGAAAASKAETTNISGLETNEAEEVGHYWFGRKDAEGRISVQEGSSGTSGYGKEQSARYLKDQLNRAVILNSTVVYEDPNGQRPVIARLVPQDGQPITLQNIVEAFKTGQDSPQGGGLMLFIRFKNDPTVKVNIICALPNKLDNPVGPTPEFAEEFRPFSEWQNDQKPQDSARIATVLVSQQEQLPYSRNGHGHFAFPLEQGEFEGQKQPYFVGGHLLSAQNVAEIAAVYFPANKMIQVDSTSKAEPADTLGIARVKAQDLGMSQEEFTRLWEQTGQNTQFTGQILSVWENPSEASYLTPEQLTEARKITHDRMHSFFGDAIMNLKEQVASFGKDQSDLNPQQQNIKSLLTLYTHYQTRLIEAELAISKMDHALKDDSFNQPDYNPSIDGKTPRQIWVEKISTMKHLPDSIKQVLVESGIENGYLHVDELETLTRAYEALGERGTVNKYFAAELKEQGAREIPVLSDPEAAVLPIVPTVVSQSDNPSHINYFAFGWDNLKQHSRILGPVFQLIENIFKRISKRNSTLE